MKLSKWKRCPGEHGVYADHCMICAPFWAQLPTCGAGCLDEHGGPNPLELSATRKTGTCDRCGGRFTVDKNDPARKELRHG